METFHKLFGSLLGFIYHCFDRIVIQGYGKPAQEIAIRDGFDPSTVTDLAASGLRFLAGLIGFLPRTSRKRRRRRLTSY